MAKTNEGVKPQARTSELVIKEMVDELLVYDLRRHRAHCLNQSAALIWRQCNGERPVSEIAALVARQFGGELDEQAVWLGIEELSKKGLLERPVRLAAKASGMSRRQLMSRLGWGAVAAIPLITTILAPTASAAASCVGVSCAVNPTVCGTQCVCNGVTCM